MSSAMLITPSTSLVILSNTSWRTSSAIFNPNGSFKNLNFPQGVLNVVNKLLARSRGTFWFPEFVSVMDTTSNCASCGSTSSMILQYYWFLLIALFKSLGSRHSLKLPSGFFTGTMEFIHSVCPCTSVMIPASSNL